MHVEIPDMSLNLQDPLLRLTGIRPRQIGGIPVGQVFTDCARDWSTIAHCNRELTVYWYQWDNIEIKDEILCKKQFTVNDFDYLYIIPTSLRKEVFKHLHDYITGDILVGTKLMIS